MAEHGYPSGQWQGRARLPTAGTVGERYDEVGQLRHYASPTSGVRERARRMRTSYKNSSNWKKIRQGILERDAYTCQSCGVWGEGVTLDVDHIIEWADGGSNDPSNLWTLCRRCHAQKSQITAKAVGRPHRGSRGSQDL